MNESNCIHTYKAVSRGRLLFKSKRQTNTVRRKERRRRAIYNVFYNVYQLKARPPRTASRGRDAPVRPMQYCLGKKSTKNESINETDTKEREVINQKKA